MSDTPLDQITIDADIQQRAAGIDTAVVSDYRAILDANPDWPFPPVVAFRDETGTLFLADGFHRYAAASHTGRRSIPIEIRSGTRRDALLYAVGANAAHGLRRTNEDKRRAVLTLLQDAEWSVLSDRQIAERAKVHHGTVAKIRHELSAADQLAIYPTGQKLTSSDQPAATTEPSSTPTPQTHIGRDGKSYPAKRQSNTIPPEHQEAIDQLRALATKVRGEAPGEPIDPETAAVLRKLDENERVTIDEVRANLAAVKAMQQRAHARAETKRAPDSSPTPAPQETAPAPAPTARRTPGELSPAVAAQKAMLEAGAALREVERLRTVIVTHREAAPQLVEAARAVLLWLEPMMQTTEGSTNG